MNNYTIKTTDKDCIDMSKAGSTTLCYRMSYQDLKTGNHGLDIHNNFIVYILHAKNYKGKDYLYIGKSKNGISARPKQHEDKGINWDTCYILTQFLSRTFLNDGTIQYLEHIITEKAKETHCYNVTTQQTTKGTINSTDEMNCKIFLDEIIKMLFILGLDLKTIKEENEDITPIIKPESNNINYWMYTAGYHSFLWEDFYKDNVMGIGWEEVGDLKVFKNQSEIQRELKNIYNEPSSFSHTAKCLWQFANEIKAGDVIFVKDGTHKVIGCGIVQSDYIYDTERLVYEDFSFPNIREVQWISNKEKIIKRNIGRKTLTQIKALDYINEIRKIYNI